MARLKKAQRTHLLEWIAEGLETDEINDRAAQLPEEERFDVSRQVVDYYRRTREIALEALKEQAEGTALTTGLARVEERVRNLNVLGNLVLLDLLEDGLIADDKKGVGQGPNAVVVDVLRFKGAELEAYLKINSEIAAELGQRKQVIEASGPNGAPLMPQIKTVTVILNEKPVDPQ